MLISGATVLTGSGERLDHADVLLRDGEVLYIPPHWWHYVEAQETSFSVSFWWS